MCSKKRVNRSCDVHHASPVWLRPCRCSLYVTSSSSLLQLIQIAFTFHIHPSIHIYLSFYLSFYLPMCNIRISFVYLSIHPSVHPYTCIYLSFYISLNIKLFWNLLQTSRYLNFTFLIKIWVLIKAGINFLEFQFIFKFPIKNVILHPYFNSNLTQTLPGSFRFPQVSKYINK